MAKKSFKDNPALNFISPPPSAPKAPKAPRPAREPAAEPQASRPAREAAPVPAQPPAGLKPLYVETKSRRVQLLMQPSLHEKLKTAAAERGQSLNDLIHTVLSDWSGQDN